MKFRTKPTVIEAIQFDGSKKSFDEIWDWMGGDDGPNCGYTGPSEDDPRGFAMLVPDGRAKATIGDWVIKGIKGEFYPCKPDIFTATYEPVAE